MNVNILEFMVELVDLVINSQCCYGNFYQGRQLSDL